MVTTSINSSASLQKKVSLPHALSPQLHLKDSQVSHLDESVKESGAAAYATASKVEKSERVSLQPEAEDGCKILVVSYSS